MTQQVTGAELLIDALKKNGLKNIYGVVGIPVTDLARMAQRSGMRYFGFRREDSAVNAAAASGFLTGKPGLALTVSAPGFLNGLVALAEATKNCMPVIMISGSSERHIIDLNRGDYEGLDQYNIAKPFCKAAYRVDRPEDMGLAVARAIRSATTGRPGGVYLDLPADTIGAILDENIDPESTIIKEDDPAKMRPAKAEVAHAVDVLKQAKKPLIILGKVASIAHAEDGVREFIETTKIPYLPMSMAKGLLPDDSEACVAAARSLSFSEADVIMLVGARLNWMLSHGNKFNPNAKLIQIDVDPDEIDSNKKIEAPLVGDMNAVLEELNPAVKKAGIKASQDWLDALKAKKDENFAKMQKRLTTPRSPMGYYGAMRPIKELIRKNPDTYVVSEGANTLDIGRNVIDIFKPRHRLDSGTWGVMGVGLGYAIGTAIETGEKVVCVEGDSAFGFDGMEIETICRLHLPITIVIFNNGGIYNGAEKNPAGSDPAPITLDAKGRYDKLSEAFGGLAYDVKTPEELDKALNEAYDSGKPAIINAVIDPALGKESGHIGNLNPKLGIKH